MNVETAEKVWAAAGGPAGESAVPAEEHETLSQRGQNWLDFSAGVLEHIETYTVPQYGDKGNDHVSSYSAAECVRQAEKYLKRFGRNSRPGEEVLDMLKAAHFIQIATDKMQEATDASR